MLNGLKIAVDARPLSFPMTGITRYTHELIIRLVENSPHEWYLYCHRPPVHPVPDLPNVHLRYAAQPFPGGEFIYAHLVFPVWARKDTPDLFWSPRHHLPLALPRRIKTLLTIHDLVWKSFPETMTLKGRMLERALMPCSIARADKVLTVSRSVARELKTHYPGCSSGLEVIYPGKSAQLEPVEKNNGAPYFLFVGTREPRKNLPRLIRAFKLFAGSNTTCSLVVAGGEGWEKKPLQGMILSFGLEHRVKLTDRVTESKLAEYYAGCIAMVLPSLYEGFGLPLVEAMGYGAPVITTGYGACREIAGRAGFFVDPHSEQSICDAMLALTDTRLQQRLAEFARQRAFEFNWEKAAACTIQAMHSLT